MDAQYLAQSAPDRREFAAFTSQKVRLPNCLRAIMSRSAKMPNDHKVMVCRKYVWARPFVGRQPVPDLCWRDRCRNLLKASLPCRWLHSLQHARSKKKLYLLTSRWLSKPRLANTNTLTGRRSAAAPLRNPIAWFGPTFDGGAPC